MQKKLLSVLLCICALLSFVGCAKDIELNKSEISYTSIEGAGLVAHFIDVGQGDCILLESQGEFALVDAGEYSEVQKAVSYLKDLGVENIEYLISTHPHSDHCGGLSEIIRYFDCKFLISPKTGEDSHTWNYVLDAADERGVSFETPKVSDVYTLGEATITILSPEENNIYANMNNYSIVCRVDYQNTSMLLTGDAEKLVERELIRDKKDISADILKCGHHGSSTSTCEEFLDAVNPSAAIITCGKNNDYGHPHKEVTSALTARQIPYWQTATQGNIIVATDGDKISITTQKAEVPISTASTEKPEILYVGNKNSKVFHSQYCESVEQTREKNKVYLNTRQEAIDSGYKPCKNCNP